MNAAPLNPQKEQELIKKSKRDRRAFAPLYEFYHPRIERFFKIRIVDEVKSEDLTSKVFEKALIGLDNFQWQGVSFSAWLYKIARNTLIDFFRESGKAKRNIPISDAPPLRDKGKTPEQLAIQKDGEDILHRLLEKLPSRERNIIYLKFFDGYTNRTIAKLTGLSETNVGTIVYRVVRKLRKELSAKV